MENLYHLSCPACGAQQERGALRCGQCGGLLAVELTRFVPPGERHPFAEVGGAGAMWRANPVLPIADPRCIVSLGEGGMPCLPAARMGVDSGISVWLKNEAANPTGSFKDRQVSVGISRARELGRREFYVVSSGNVGAAAAAYSARAGAVCWVIAPASAPAGKLLQMQLCGARVVRVAEDSFERLFLLAEQASAEFGWHSLSTAARASPFNIVGGRTIAAELVEQAPGLDWVVSPVGGGGLLGGVWQGFKDALQLRPGLRLPRMAAVQPSGCAPFVRAVEQGWHAAQALANPWQEVDTIAGGLADDIPFDAHVALPAVRESGGVAVAVSDDEIRQAQHLLARDEGLFIEPSGAVSAAGLLKLIKEGRIRSGETACCLLTGSGLKDPASVGDVPQPPVIAAEIAELRQVVRVAREQTNRD